MSDMISAAQAASVVRCKKTLHKAAIRKGFILPPFKDTLITKKYLLGIIDGTYWCLKKENRVLYQQVADEPTKQVLAKMLKKEMLKQDASPAG